MHLHNKSICLIIVQHPAVSECCVLGLPDKAYGEAVTAIVVPDVEIKKARDNDLKPALTLDELCSMAKQKLAPYKVALYQVDLHINLSTIDTLCYEHHSYMFHLR